MPPTTDMGAREAWAPTPRSTPPSTNPSPERPRHPIPGVRQTRETRDPNGQRVRPAVPPGWRAPLCPVPIRGAGCAGCRVSLGACGVPVPLPIRGGAPTGGATPFRGYINLKLCIYKICNMEILRYIRCMNKDGSFIFRCSETDLLRWKADAERAGMSMGAWIRHCLNKVGGRIPIAKVEVAEREQVEQPRQREAVEVGMGRVGAVQSSDVEQERQRARALAQRHGRCTADVTRGVRCRLCGKMHQ